MQSISRKPHQSGYSSLVSLVIIIVAILSGVLGFWLGKYRLADPAPVSTLPTDDSHHLAQEQRAIQANIDAIAIRVAEMQAEILRMNALGQRLVKMAELNEEEFDFENPAGAGGPHWLDERTNSLHDVSQDLTQLLALLEDRQRKLGLLETLIMERELKRHTVPDGWPLATRGVVTSGFGMRRHPITGRYSMHRGIDIAARPGSPILAMADGLVVFSGRKPGYGNIVEIRHPNGIKTRYAHNQENLVQEGDLVNKGERIALVGSTGSSTGPHVHFEVIRNGRAVNPIGYLDPDKLQVARR